MWLDLLGHTRNIGLDTSNMLKDTQLRIYEYWKRTNVKLRLQTILLSKVLQGMQYTKMTIILLLVSCLNVIYQNDNYSLILVSCLYYEEQFFLYVHTFTVPSSNKVWKSSCVTFHPCTMFQHNRGTHLGLTNLPHYCSLHNRHSGENNLDPSILNCSYRSTEHGWIIF